MPALLIESETRDALLNYLGTKPFVEVFALVQVLAALQSVKSAEAGRNDEPKPLNAESPKG